MAGEFERPPYFIAGKGGDTRLARALRLCIDEKITPNSDGSYQVEGSHWTLLPCGDSCSCPNSQKASTKWCYHAVGVALYVEWQRRLRPTAPVALGTLRAGTLPLPPTTVDERLALGTVRTPAPITVRTTATTSPRRTVCLTMRVSPEHLRPTTRLWPLWTPRGTRRQPTPAPVKIPREFTVNIKGKTHVLYTGLVIAARHDGLVSLSADWTYNDAELSLAHAVATFADGRRYEESGRCQPEQCEQGH